MAAQQGDQTSSDMEEIGGDSQQDIPQMALFKKKCLKLLTPRMISLKLVFIIFSTFTFLEARTVKV